MAEHYRSEMLLAYQGRLLDATQQTEVRQHLSSCTHCSQNIQLLSLKHLQKSSVHFAAMAENTGDGTQECISTEDIGKYLIDELQAVLRHKIEQHLAACEKCRGVLGDLIRASLSSVSQKEKDFIESKNLPDVQENVDKILKLLPNRPDKQLPTDSILSKLFPSSFSLSYLFKPAIAVATAVIFIIGLGWFTQEKIYDSRVQKAQQLMAENVRIYYLRQPRLAGDYKNSLFAQVRSPKEVNSSEKTPAQKIQSNLQKAVGYKPENITVLHSLIQFFIWQKNYEDAEALFTRLALREGTSLTPELLNDRGVLYFQSRQYEKSEVVFKEAISQNAHLEQAFYNLAVVQTELGKHDDALKNWEKYLTVEESDEWRNAAEQQIRQMRERL